MGALTLSPLTYSRSMSASTQDSTSPAPGWRLATIGGVPVYIGRSWPIIALVIVTTFGPGIASSRPYLGFGAYAVAAAYAVLLLVSVLAHEAAHGVVADLWGGHTAYNSSNARPGASALVAVAGPAANALLALIGWLAAPHIGGDITSLLVGAIWFTNAFVAGGRLAHSDLIGAPDGSTAKNTASVEYLAVRPLLAD